MLGASQVAEAAAPEIHSEIKGEKPEEESGDFEPQDAPDTAEGA